LLRRLSVCNLRNYCLYCKTAKLNLHFTKKKVDRIDSSSTRKGTEFTIGTDPFVDGDEDEDCDDNDDLFDGRRDEDVVGNELGREVDAIRTGSDGEPDDHHEEDTFAKFLFLQKT
jgi:hypothetical protein